VEAPYTSDGYSEVLSAFTLSPQALSEQPFTLSLPAGTAHPEDIALAVVTAGVTEGEGTVTWPLWSSDETTENTAIFYDIALTSAIYQPLSVDEASNERGHTLAGTTLGQRCSTVIASYDAAAAAVIDQYVRVSTPMASQARARHAALSGDPTAQADFISAINRFHARSCYSAYKAQLYEKNVLGYYIPTRPIALTMDWSNITCKALGTASGNGLNIFFNPKCDVS
jgi:predicted protein tyrosine phosphatase